MKAIHRFKCSLARARKKGAAQPDEAPKENEARKPPKTIASVADIAALIAQQKTILLAPEAEEEEKTKGHAHDISDQEPLFLGIGMGARDAFVTDEKTPDVVSDSPTAVDFNVYDRAYEEAINERMKQNQSSNPVMYLTKHIKEKDYFKKLENLVDEATVSLSPFKSVVENSKQLLDPLPLHPGNKLADLVSKVRVSDTSENSSKTRDQN
jgi:[calcium/calmodulin-dependent protein kinase] kinase